MDEVKVAAPAPTPDNNQEKAGKNMKMFLYGLIGLLAVAVVGILGVDMYRVYAKAATDSFTVTTAKIFRLPAAKVNGTTILYGDYASDMKAIGKLREYDRANNGATAELTDEQLSDQVLWRLMNTVLVSDAAKEMGIKATDEEVAALKSQVLTQFNTAEAANEELNKRYGWNMDIYEDKVLRPFVLQNKLAEQIQSDETKREAVRAQAQAVLEKVKAGEDFAALAKQYGQDGTKDSGGDLGWFARGDMVPQFEEAAFALKKGEVTQELVETQYGYHVIKLTDKRTVKEDGKSVEEIRASHILFQFPSATTYLDELAAKANIHLYIRVHNPFEEVKK